MLVAGFRGRATIVRHVLPARRPNATFDKDWNGHRFTVTVGFDPQTGRPMEVFADTPKGGQMQATLADTCVLISIALQSGVAPAALAKSLAKEPDPMRGSMGPASPVGAVMEVLLACEMA